MDRTSRTGPFQCVEQAAMAWLPACSSQRLSDELTHRARHTNTAAVSHARVVYTLHRRPGGEESRTERSGMTGGMVLEERSWDGREQAGGGWKKNYRNATSYIYDLHYDRE